MSAMGNNRRVFFALVVLLAIATVDWIFRGETAAPALFQFVSGIFSLFIIESTYSSCINTTGKTPRFINASIFSVLFAIFHLSPHKPANINLILTAIGLLISKTLHWNDNLPVTRDRFSIHIFHTLAIGSLFFNGVDQGGQIKFLLMPLIVGSLITPAYSFSIKPKELLSTLPAVISLAIVSIYCGLTFHGFAKWMFGVISFLTVFRAAYLFSTTKFFFR